MDEVIRSEVFRVVLWLIVITVCKGVGQALAEAHKEGKLGDKFFILLSIGCLGLAFSGVYELLLHLVYLIKAI